MGVVGVTLGGIVGGHVTSARIGDYSSCAAAAQQMVAEKLEQARSAKWDTVAYPATDELVSNNFTTVVGNLDLPGAKGAAVPATLTTRISDISMDPPLRMVSVDCVWSLGSHAPFTNSITTFRCPDQ